MLDISDFSPSMLELCIGQMNPPLTKIILNLDRKAREARKAREILGVRRVKF